MAKQRSFSMGNTLAFGNINDLPVSNESDSTKAVAQEMPVENKVNAALSSNVEAANEAAITPKENVLPVPEKKIKERKSSPASPVVKKVVSHSDVKKTSLRIQRSSLNYLAYASKINNMNQNDYLSSILEVDAVDTKASKPDFNAVVEKRHVIDTVVKGVQLPEDILNKAKHQAALEMKSLSEYIDDILQKRMKE